MPVAIPLALLQARNYHQRSLFFKVPPPPVLVYVARLSGCRTHRAPPPACTSSPTSTGARLRPLALLPAILASSPCQSTSLPFPCIGSSPPRGHAAAGPSLRRGHAHGKSLRPDAHALQPPPAHTHNPSAACPLSLTINNPGWEKDMRFIGGQHKQPLPHVKQSAPASTPVQPLCPRLLQAAAAAFRASLSCNAFYCKWSVCFNCWGELQPPRRGGSLRFRAAASFNCHGPKASPLSRPSLLAQAPCLQSRLNLVAAQKLGMQVGSQLRSCVPARSRFPRRQRQPRKAPNGAETREHSPTRTW